jgi:DNA-binding NarL/FixJ family response regulator
VCAAVRRRRLPAAAAAAGLAPRCGHAGGGRQCDCLDLAVTHRVLSAFRAHASPALRPADASLTPRELEVLRLVGRGLANGEIAQDLYISEVTVKAHLGHVLTKLGLRDRAAAIGYAFDTGLVAPGG